MSSIIWYIYEFARKTWIDGFFDAKSKEDIAHIPDRFRDFPKVIKENCIGCGSCTASCPSPNAIKLVRVEKTISFAKNSISFLLKGNILLMIIYASDVKSVWMPVK